MIKLPSVLILLWISRSLYLSGQAMKFGNKECVSEAKSLFIVVTCHNLTCFRSLLLSSIIKLYYILINYCFNISVTTGKKQQL